MNNMQKVYSKVFSLLVGILLPINSSLADGLSCRHGLTWTISRNSAWGLGLPVVTRVAPYSAAEESGFKVGDIIERIDGYSTDRLSPEQITTLLQSNSSLHTLQTSNLNALHKRRILAYHCKPTQGLTERELAEIFSLYSTEDTNLEYVTYPYSYSYSASVSLMDLKDYAFSKPTFDGEDALNIAIDQALKSKGLLPSSQSNILVSTRYRLDSLNADRSHVRGSETSYGMSWRYVPQLGELKPYPIYGQTQSGVESALYLITLEVRMHDKQTRELLWSCLATDYLSEYLSLEDYAEQAIPTMLMGFPFAMQTNAPRLALHTLRYNYTGLIYDARQLNRIADVADGSPAMKAGLRPGDLVRSINGLPIELSTTDAYIEQYFRTAERLDRYRDRALPPLRSLVGTLSVPYWKVSSYADISSIIEQPKSGAAFSYLFAFRPYISTRETKAVIYEIQRGKETYYVPITPEIRNESTAYPY